MLFCPARKPRFRLSALMQLCWLAGFTVAAVGQTVSDSQLPVGGQVRAGQATISQSGNTLQINQSSQRAVVDWSSFNIGAQAQVQFQQPESNFGADHSAGPSGTG